MHAGSYCFVQLMSVGGVVVRLSRRAKPLVALWRLDPPRRQLGLLRRRPQVGRHGAELSRRLQRDTVAPVYSVDRPIGTQPLKSTLDGIAQPLVRAHHANGDIPVEVRLTLVGTQDADRLIRMRQIEIGGNGWRDSRRVDLMIGHG